MNIFAKELDTNELLWSFVRDKDVSIGSIFEPTINPAFNQLIGRLNEYNARISITTNALNLSRKKLNNLYHSKLHLVHFSFDGATKETYEYIRQRSRYELVVSNIKHFIEAHKNSEATFIINFTVCKSNMKEIVPAIDLWESLGIHMLGLIAMVSRDEDPFFRENSLVDEIDRYEAMIEAAANHIIKKNYRIALSSPHFSIPEVRERYENYSPLPGVIGGTEKLLSRNLDSMHHYYGAGKSIIPHKPCRSPLTTARIDYDGNVYLCQSIQVGNLYENTFEEIWNSEERKRIISQLIDNPKHCNSCDYFRFCIGSQSVDYEEPDNFASQKLLSGDFMLSKIQLVTEDYHGFNIVVVDGIFYGLLQTEGEFSLERVEKEEYLVLFKNESEANVRRQIKEYQQNAQVYLSSQTPSQGKSDLNSKMSRPSIKVELVQEGYQNFNILKVNSQYYAIPQGEGEFSLERVEQQDYSVSFIANNETGLQQKIVAHQTQLKSQFLKDGIRKIVSFFS